MKNKTCSIKIFQMISKTLILLLKIMSFSLIIKYKLDQKIVIETRQKLEYMFYLLIFRDSSSQSYNYIPTFYVK